MQKRREEPKQPIVVLGDYYYGFPLYHWREGIKKFLDLVWSAKYNFGEPGGKTARENKRLGRGNVVIWITTHDQARFGDPARLSVSFESVNAAYQATGSAYPLKFDKCRTVLEGEKFGGRGNFESLLAQFACNKTIDGLVLPLTDPRYVGTIGMTSVEGRLRIGIQAGFNYCRIP